MKLPACVWWISEVQNEMLLEWRVEQAWMDATYTVLGFDEMSSFDERDWQKLKDILHT